MFENRFQDANKNLDDYQNEVLVKCPGCDDKAIARANYEQKNARLFCPKCGYIKEASTHSNVLGITGFWKMAAHQYFGATLFLQHPFKNDVFWAYNDQHLAYLEQYISAGLREHKDRIHFTLLERLPKFYHQAKNRAALLKIIQRLKDKSASIHIR